MLSHLDFQKVVPTNTLVVHLMVGIICVTTALILNESESAYVSTRLELTRGKG